MRPSAYLPWKRVSVTWIERGEEKCHPVDMRVWQAWLVIPLLYLLCVLDGVWAARARFSEIPLDKRRE